MEHDAQGFPILTLEERRKHLLHDLRLYDARRLRITLKDLEELGIEYQPDEHGELYVERP